MEIKATVKLSISPRKMRLIRDAVKGRSIEEAENALLVLDKRGAYSLLKLVKSAIANAIHNAKLNKEELLIHDIQVSDGVSMKRVRFASRGRTHPYKRRTTQVAIYLIKK